MKRQNIFTDKMTVSYIWRVLHIYILCAISCVESDPTSKEEIKKFIISLNDAQVDADSSKYSTEYNLGNISEKNLEKILISGFNSGIIPLNITPKKLSTALKKCYVEPTGKKTVNEAYRDAIRKANKIGWDFFFD